MNYCIPVQFIESKITLVEGLCKPDCILSERSPNRDFSDKMDKKPKTK
jgi:hypothetical protein